MKFAADFHLHSKYSRATSSQMDLENLDKWAKIKGLKVLGTGDFTHPKWLENLKDKLKPAESGLYILKNSNDQENFKTRFILTSEISCIYSKNNKIRKIHLIIFSPSLETAKKINLCLESIGNLKADGRPILGLDAKELLKIVLNISEDCFVVCSHAWTPWFSIFGSKSGFDSIEECFDDYSKYIFAIETGLSSNPLMNWRLSMLDKISLISNSDAHSLEKIGREANVFDVELNYSEIINAIKSKNPKKFLYTIEFFPEQGKYHFDGHRSCQISFHPQESKKHNNICPVCKRPLTIGVLNRVNVLADRQEGFKLERAIPFKSLVPLREIIADVLNVGLNTKQVNREYEKLIKKFNNEFEILLNIDVKDLETAVSSELIAQAIIKVRQGEVNIEPGYDGVYGKIKIPLEKKEKIQKSLF